MIYYVFYRSENSDYLKLHDRGKYTCIKTELKSKYKKVAFKFAVKMNNHIKKFHKERFGKDVYFIKGV